MALNSSSCVILMLLLFAVSTRMSQNGTGNKLSKLENKQINNEVYLHNKGMSFFSKRQWQQAYDTLIEAWRAYNETEQHHVRHGNNKLENTLFYAQLSASHVGKFAEARTLCRWMLASNLKLNELQREHCESQSKEYTFQLAAEQLGKIEDFSERDRKKIAQDLLATKVYEFCDKEFAIRRRQELARDPKLFCRLDNRNGHPMLMLSPVKEEIYNHDPPVVLIHNICLKSEIIYLKRISSRQMGSAKLQVHSAQRDRQLETNFKSRKTNVSWISNNDMPKGLNRRIEVYIGLEVGGDGSEVLQVAHYKIGGHYRPQLDAFQHNVNDNVGDRIATLLLYASRVIQGGGTVFTNLKLHVTPVPGAGLFWYNLHRNETVDTRTTHGACPVTQGEKWAANKWFRQRAQFRRRSCGLTQEQDYTMEDASGC